MSQDSRAALHANILAKAMRGLVDAESRLIQAAPGTPHHDMLLILKSTSETILRAAHDNDPAPGK